MKIFPNISLLLLFLFLNYVVFTQINGWGAYFGNFKITNNWTVHSEMQLRNGNFQTLDQVLLRNGIGYNFSEDNNNLLLGYAFIQTNTHALNGNQRFHEQRIFQQFITKERFGRLFLMHRYRFEQRIMEDSFKLRFRYFLTAYVALNEIEIKKGTYYLAFMNEIFISPHENYFDQNRVAVGLGLAITNNIKIEVDFMRQILPSRGINQIQLTVFNNIAFKHHR